MKNEEMIAKVTNGTVITLAGTTVNDVPQEVIAKALANQYPIIKRTDRGTWVVKRNVSNALLTAFGNVVVETRQPEPVVVVNNPVMAFLSTAVDMKPKELFCSDLKWKFLTRCVLRGKNVMMTGAAGTGKTYTAQQVAKGLDREFYYFNLGATQDPRSTLIGNTHFREGEGTLFNASLFVKAIQTENAIILLDELSRANPEAWNILMTVLDEGQRYLRLDEQEGAPTIKVASGVSFIATANIGNEFTSTRVMDRALMDRFTIVEVDALDEENETKLLMQNYPGLDVKYANAIANIADMTRRELKTDSPRISSAISTRSTLELAGLIYDGFTLDEATQVAVLPFFDAEGGVDSERTFIQQLIQKHSHLDQPKTVSDSSMNDVFTLDM
jgi:nitric oxide reductase NorQ protein